MLMLKVAWLETCVSCALSLSRSVFHLVSSILFIVTLIIPSKRVYVHVYTHWMLGSFAVIFA